MVERKRGDIIEGRLCRMLHDLVKIQAKGLGEQEEFREEGRREVTL